MLLLRCGSKNNIEIGDVQQYGIEVAAKNLFSSRTFLAQHADTQVSEDPRLRNACLYNTSDAGSVAVSARLQMYLLCLS
jgi:hypothetical protein